MTREQEDKIIKQAEKWYDPNLILPNHAHNGHKFIVYYRMRYAHHKDEEDKELLKDMGYGEYGWEYGTALVTWNESLNEDNSLVPIHNGKNFLTYKFDWSWDVWEGQEEFEVLKWREIPEFIDPNGEIINLSNPCNQSYEQRTKG